MVTNLSDEFVTHRPLDRPMTLFEAWQEMNWKFINAEKGDRNFYQIPQQTTVNYTMEAFGFGLPEYEFMWIGKRGVAARVRVLEKRYINDVLWNDAVNQLKLNFTKKSKLVTSTFRFFASRPQLSLYLLLVVAC